MNYFDRQGNPVDMMTWANLSKDDKRVAEDRTEPHLYMKSYYA